MTEEEIGYISLYPYFHLTPPHILANGTLKDAQEFHDRFPVAYERHLSAMYAVHDEDEHDRQESLRTLTELSDERDPTYGRYSDIKAKLRHLDAVELHAWLTIVRAL